jgi:hypothetical protein
MMSTLNADRKKCKRLRSKGMFIETEPDPTVPDCGDGFYWCTHTMNCLGPDGKPVLIEECKPKRSCFEVH